MSLLVGVHNIKKSHGTQILFDGISFTISDGDRLGLIGANGSGKSTLLKILMEQEKPDAGHVTKRNRLEVGYASQSPEFPDSPLEEILVRHAKQGDEVDRLTQARILLTKMQFTDFTQSAARLSGGWKKRLDIARALINTPDLLLFDEPTNHLDLEGILWLEKFLMREKLSYILVSHDRYFLENTCTKILEISRSYAQGIFISEGSMSLFTERKEAFLKGLAQQERGLASVVRYETEWLKKSPKARTTKSQARVQKAHELIEELSDLKRRNKVSKVDLAFSASERETRKLLVAKNLSKSAGEKTLFRNLDFTLSPGSRLGIVGKNGTGKTTLLKVLARMIPPDSGTLKYADNLKLVYFDQHREQISPHLSLKEALSPHSDYIHYRGQQIHVHGWAKRFLFSTDRLSLPVGSLSGGEQARILIAKLMLEPADILFLDEPTNDLDIATLEVIEESLKEFAGAVILISHDRCLMDQLCTQILVLGEEAEEQRFFSDYSQWEAHKRSPPKIKESTASPAITTLQKQQQKKLSYLEEKELQGIEKRIEEAEVKIAQLQKELDDPATYVDSGKSLELYRLLGEAQKQLERLFDRWTYLDSITQQSS
jgi:ATP-binding cassette subfamily F protein uup